MNTFGQLFRVTTFGESHGPAIGCVVDGCPPGIALAAEDFEFDLARRATGKTRHTSARREAVEVEILSGIYEGHTTGTPIALLVRGYLAQIGTILPRECDWAAVESNPFFWPDSAQVPELEAFMDALRKSGDSVGARVSVIATGVPPGWGEPVYGKLDAEIAAAMMSINAVKGVEIGDGFASVAQHGSAHRDEATASGFLSNHAGGILGGISSGQQVLVSAAFKPTSSLRLPARGLDTAGNEVEVVTTGRHDPCVGIRAVPICEAMLALVLMDQALRHRAQCGDVGDVFPRIP